VNNYHSLLLSPNMSISTEGYLICHNVPICRSGSQDYLGQELDGMTGYEASWNLEPHLKYKVFRPVKEVLHPDTIRSFEGKSVVDTHPTSENNVVHIDNERYLNCGHVQNVKEGDKYQGEVTLQADLHIKDPQLREKIRPEQDPNSPTALRDVSCGYTAKVRRVNGRLEMYDIRGNHVAAGIEKGRAGPGIAIRDSAPPEIKPIRSTKMSFLDKIFGTGLKAVMADATPEELAELNKEFGKTHHITIPTAAPAIVADATVKETNPHSIAAHHCLDRCLTAMKSKDKMGVDAFGTAVGIKSLYLELGRYVGDEDMTEDAKPPMDAAAADEKPEELTDAKPPVDAADAADAAVDEKPPTDAADAISVGNTGMSVLHQVGDKSANDAVIAHVKVLKPIVAAYMSIPKKSRTTEQQVVIDSYNKTVKEINASRGNAYAVLTKVQQPESNGAIVVADASATEDYSKFYEGVPFRVGKKRHDEYLAQKGSK
jgi:hypothetical protein